MTNRGIAPLDPGTEVGQLRLLVGDTEYVEFIPPEVGYGDYNNFSDDELNGFIVAGGGSLTRASGYAYLRLAALAAASAISWRSDDLAVDSKLVASEYRLLARIAFEQADGEDELLASGFALDFPFSCGGCGSCGECIPELAPAPVKWCRRQCGGSCGGFC